VNGGGGGGGSAIGRSEQAKRTERGMYTSRVRVPSFRRHRRGNKKKLTWRRSVPTPTRPPAGRSRASIPIRAPSPISLSSAPYPPPP
jgi:hypothetical protein